MDPTAPEMVAGSTKPQSLAFLNLPYDIRLLIYEAVLLCDDKIAVDVYNPLTSHHGLNGRLHLSINVKLIRTCKAVYEEAFPMLYSKNQFLFTGNARTAIAVDRLISRKARSHLTTVHLDASCFEETYQFPRITAVTTTAFYELCNTCPALKNVILDHALMARNRNDREDEKADRNAASFLIRVSQAVACGFKTTLFPQVTAKIEIARNSFLPRPYLNDYFNWQIWEPSSNNVFYSPPNAKTSMTGTLMRSPLERVLGIAARTPGVGWTSPQLHHGKLDGSVVVGSIVELTLAQG